MRQPLWIFQLLCLASTTFIAGCGSTPPPAGNTETTLLITADNNAQIPIFKFAINALTLVASDGSTVPVLTTPQLVELGSINGVARPLVTAQIPQGTYTSVKLTYGASTFVVIDRSGGPGTIDIGNYNIGPIQSASTTVTQTLATPLQITGSAMGLLFDLNIPQSTTYTPYFNGSSTVLQPGGGQTKLTPVYKLTGVTVAAQPTNLLNGRVEDVHGQVTANAAGAITMTSDSGATLSFTTGPSTVFAGPNGTTAPVAGSYVDVDAALQTDGTMLATLVQTEAASTAYDLVGQVMQYSLQQYVQSTGREQQGPNLPNTTGFYGDNVSFGSSTQFEIAWPNGVPPAGLSFTPALNTATLVVGQNVATPLTTPQYINNVIPTIGALTLEPQTFDGTIMATSTANGQTTYQVELFPNDLIALFGPSQTISVHVTSATQNISTTALAVGATARFRGLLFNDGGTLRLVASTIEDGVAGP
jgi:hypothetical protein